MDFSTHCYPSSRPSRWAMWLLACALVCWPWLARADVVPAEISLLQVERADDGVFLTAHIKFELSAAVEDALLKGIPVHFVAQAQLLRDRWYWYDKKLITATRQMRLTYQPLTRRWKISLTQGAGPRSGIALNQNFDTLPEALQSLSRLSRWRIADAVEVDPEARHNVDFSFRLDSSELPRPLQIGILGQAEWALSVSKNQRLNLETPR